MKTTQFLSEDDALKLRCPTMDGGHAQCMASRCAAWRWRPLLTSEPGYKEAVAAATKLPKDKRGGLKPAEFVNANRKAYNLPTEPYVGWCGLAGRPEV